MKFSHPRYGSIHPGKCGAVNLEYIWKIAKIKKTYKMIVGVVSLIVSYTSHWWLWFALCRESLEYHEKLYSKLFIIRKYLPNMGSWWISPSHSTCINVYTPRIHEIDWQKNCNAKGVCFLSYVSLCCYYETVILDWKTFIMAYDSSYFVATLLYCLELAIFLIIVNCK